MDIGNESNTTSSFISSDSDGFWADAARNGRVMCVSASLSVVGTLVLTGLCVAFRKLRLAMWRAVFFSAVSELVFAATLVAGYAAQQRRPGRVPGAAACAAEGFVITVASFVTNAWLLFLVAILSARVRGVRRRTRPFWRVEALYCGAALAVGGATAALPLAHAGGMRYELVRSGWCHIGPRPHWARFVLYSEHWALILLIVVLMVDVYAKVLPRLLQQRHRVILPGRDMEARRRVMTLIRQVWVYPALLVLSWACTTVARLVDVGAPDSHAASLVTAAVAPAMGFLQLVAFLLTSAVPQELVARVRESRERRRLQRVYGAAAHYDDYLLANEHHDRAQSTSASANDYDDDDDDDSAAGP